MDDSSEDNPIPGSSLYNTQALPDWGGGVLHHNTFQGMCWPTESWFWDSWFGTGYPFSGRFLEWCIIFRRYESLKTDYQQPFEKLALTNIPKYLLPPRVMSMETLSWQSARKIWPYLKFIWSREKLKNKWLICHFSSLPDLWLRTSVASAIWLVLVFNFSLSSYYKDSWAMIWGRAVDTESVLPKIK